MDALRSVLGPHARLACLVAVGIVLAIVPAMLPGSFGKAVVAFIGFYALATLGLQLLMGYGGQISVGHGAFFGIGAYAYGILTTRYAIEPWTALVLSGVCNGAIAWLLGRPLFRLRGPQLALATLGFGIIVSTVFMQATWLTGGALGLGNIPPLAIGSFAFDTDLSNAYLSIGVAFAVLIVADNLMRSRVGLALKALSADEQVAASLAVDTDRHKLAVFVASAVLTGLGGTLYAAYLTYISPDAFTFILSVELLLMAIVGGLGSVWGAPVGAAFVVLMSQFLDFMARTLPPGGDTMLKSIAFGLILTAIVIFCPDGIARRFRPKAPTDRGTRVGGRVGAAAKREDPGAVTSR